MYIKRTNTYLRRIDINKKIKTRTGSQGINLIICKIVKSFVLWQKIQPTTGFTWMPFYESWVFRFRCSTGTNEIRPYSTDTVVRTVFF